MSFMRVVVREDFLEERTGEQSFSRDTYNQEGWVAWGGGCKGLNVWTIGGAADAARERGGKSRGPWTQAPGPYPEAAGLRGCGQGRDMVRAEL